MASIKDKSTAKINTYIWHGINRKGERTSGDYKGASEKDVKDALRKQGVNVTKLKKKPEPLFSFGSSNKITPMDMAMITRQIATMLSAGVPLVQSMKIVADGHEKPKMRELLTAINNDIQAGVPVADSLRPHRKYFDDLYCDLVAAGEHSGSLDTVYDRIATYKEKTEALKSKIKKALFYPAAVIAVAFGVTMLLLIFVVPQFEEIFAGFGAELPAFTQLILKISRAVQDYWYIIFGVLGFSIFAFQRAHFNSQKVRDKTDHVLLKLPIIGSILHKSSIARFSRTLATTFNAGVPLLEGLESAAGASGNALYRDAILSARREVESGLMLNIAMRTTGVFPDMLIQMIMIGEEAGSIDDMLNKVAAIYEMEVDDAVDGLTTLIEPMLMVVIGTIVGGLIIGMYLPIFEMGNVV
ncbi:type II secretion system F family protein [Psychrobium sp. 1_MG-2023]|uniref:type II secretion system F family protein n=1 Tax=Psychrobium sp. 1_MG-2023 TaxID=3062624 RepID=UPI002735CD15|nr:type II secretion system F family protein [Psychrobium sp. 1_MG-2023]MDP2562035.1 type II secretion system F family protein [Psychrobium sp. 1_MG-2023]